MLVYIAHHIVPYHLAITSASCTEIETELAIDLEPSVPTLCLGPLQSRGSLQKYSIEQDFWRRVWDSVADKHSKHSNVQLCTPIR